MVDLRVAQYSDFDRIMDLQARYRLPRKNYDEWAHIWKENPAIKDNNSFPIGWVLEGSGGDIVGYLGNIPSLCEFAGKRLAAVSTTCFVVDTKYRNSSLLLMNAFFKQKNVDLFLNTTANREGERVFSAFKARKIPSPDQDIALFWIPGYRGFAASLLRKKQIPLACAARYPLSCMMWMYDTASGRNQWRKPGREIEIRKGFDDEFDVFWQELRATYPRTVMAMRDREHLMWHFTYALSQKRLWIFVSRRDSRMTGYALFLRQDNPDICLNRVRLVDFQTIDGDPGALRDMIFSCMRKCRSEGIHVIEAVGFNEKKRACLTKCSPYKRRMLSWPFLYKAGTAALSEDLNDPRSWDASFYDGDGSI
ncbi:MAG: hypothetical protein PHS64_00695 [Candidatus Omnitrophica bacterium]|nr:hypothetical protein [Candidatus Omnitrophota bacterium]